MSASTWPPDRSLAQSAPPARPREEIAAAVLAPLFLAGEPEVAHLVLTRRRADLRRHAGEIAFPGGRQDPQDASLQDTALREAEEEIGLPRGDVEVLGSLPQVSTFATGYVIHPFVGTVPAGVAWQLSPREVDAVLELPLATISASKTRTRIQRRGISFETDAYIVDEHVIWGATARIIQLLLERLHEGGPGGALSLGAPPGEPPDRVA